MTRRDPGNNDLAFAIGNPIIRSIQGDHDGAHLRMNVAKDKRDSRPVETNVACSPGFIKTKIEPLALKKRKYIVKKRIAIGKLDDGPDWNNKQVRLEALVVLHQDQRLFGHKFRRGCGAHWR